MYPPMLRMTAKTWLRVFEFYLTPLRYFAGPRPLSEEEERDLQEEVWQEMSQYARGASIDKPIFTDEVNARARSL